MSNRNPVFVLFCLPVVAIVAVLVMGGLARVGGPIGYLFYLSYENYRVDGHQEFAANGVSQIKPAMKMDQLFVDCRHFISYGPNHVPLFNSVAYFGDRYELNMQVPVDIQSKSSGSMVGKPLFYLNEVESVSVSPSGQVAASFSRNLTFGAAKWRRVCDSEGDFSTMGFNVDDSPVPGFKKYAAACRPSN